MRIGIDIDDTISFTNAVLIEDALKYDREFLEGKGFKNKHVFSFTDMFYWTKEDKEKFLKSRIEIVAQNVPIKPHAVEVINRLKDEGNEIYIITYRTYHYFTDPFKTSKEWLDKNNVHYDKLIVNSGPKGIVCYNNSIDWFLDDAIEHCEDANKYGIKSLLFDSAYNKDNQELRRVTSWEEVYSIITKEVK